MLWPRALNGNALLGRRTKHVPDCCSVIELSISGDFGGGGGGTLVEYSPCPRYGTGEGCRPI